MAHLPGQALALINRSLADRGHKAKPGKNLVRLKKDLEQIMAYREGLEAYTALKFQTGRGLSDTLHNTKETP